MKKTIRKFRLIKDADGDYRFRGSWFCQTGLYRAFGRHAFDKEPSSVKVQLALTPKLGWSRLRTANGFHWYIRGQLTITTCGQDRLLGDLIPANKQGHRVAWLKLDKA